MISLSGTLTIKIVNGRNGPFRVGSLHTEIGDFAVKDSVLDQYDEGCYEGVFGISRVYASSYTASNRIVIETRAMLDSIALANVDELPQQEAESLEQDSLDDEPSPQGPKESPKAREDSKPDGQASAASTQAETESESASEAEADSDAELFGALWPLPDSVKLDPTVDRGRFRRQCDRLKELGYRFKPLGQVWEKA